MDLPKLLTAAEVAEYLAVSEATLERWRADGTGPNFIKAGAGIRYPANCVAEYVQQQLQLPTEAEKMQAAVQSGMPAVKAALRERREQMQALDKTDTSESDPYAVTVGNVGGTAPGVEQFVFQGGKWVPGSVLTQNVVQPAAQPHVLECR